MAHSRRDELLSKRDEKRLIKAGQRVLLESGYPNPERVGCPGDKVLRAIALRDMPLKDALDYIDHMGHCSPCFIEYTEFRKQAHRRKVFEYSFASAALVVLIVAGVWLWSGHPLPWFGEKPNVPVVATYKPMTLDLRNWMVFRGEQPPGPHRGPIQLPRERFDLTVLLPAGSEAGNYSVQISTEVGKQVVTASGLAMVRSDGVTVLRVKLDISKLSHGGYVLGIGKAGAGPAKYPLIVK